MFAPVPKMPTDAELAKACAEGDLDAGVTVASRLLTRGVSIDPGRLLALAGVGKPTAEEFDAVADAVHEARLRKYLADAKAA